MLLTQLSCRSVTRIEYWVTTDLWVLTAFSSKPENLDHVRPWLESHRTGDVFAHQPWIRSSTCLQDAYPTTWKTSAK